MCNLEVADSKKATSAPAAAAEPAQTAKAKEEPKAVAKSSEAVIDNKPVTVASQSGDDGASVPKKLEKRNSIQLFFKNLVRRAFVYLSDISDTTFRHISMVIQLWLLGFYLLIFLFLCVNLYFAICCYFLYPLDGSSTQCVIKGVGPMQCSSSYTPLLHLTLPSM